MITFQSFPKIPRFNKLPVTITEKIDGTNAQVIITEEGEFGTASRNRLITPEDDNYGFSAWAHHNKEELMKMGPGRHFGEWFGLGIQRGYGLKEKRFALFNTRRWGEHNPNTPACCTVVPILYQGQFNEVNLDNIMYELGEQGSQIAPNFMEPEGICIHFKDGYTKRTFENEHKWERKHIKDTSTVS